MTLQSIRGTRPSLTGAQAVPRTGKQSPTESYTGVWIVSGGLLLLIGVVGQIFVVGLLGTLLLATILAAWLWAHYSLSRVSYERALSTDRMFAGEEVTLEVRLTNLKPLALPWVLVEDRLDAPLAAVDSKMIPGPKQHRVRRTVSACWFDRVRWRYVVSCPRRGYYRIGPALLRSGDPFGFHEREREVSSEVGVLVYPRSLALHELGLGRRFPFEGSRTARTLLDDPLNVVGARPYAEGDTLRQVHWRASARSMELQSKVWRPTTRPSVLILLDLNSARHSLEGTDVDAVERAISAAATVAREAHSVRCGLGLVINAYLPGTKEQARVGGGRSDSAYERVMEVLARISPYFHAVPFAEMLRMERGRVPVGATVVAITSIDSPEVRDQLRIYRRTGVEALLVNVGPVPGAPRQATGETEA